MNPHKTSPGIHTLRSRHKKYHITPTYKHPITSTLNITLLSHELPQKTAPTPLDIPQLRHSGNSLSTSPNLVAQVTPTQHSVSASHGTAGRRVPRLGPEQPSRTSLMEGERGENTGINSRVRWKARARGRVVVRGRGRTGGRWRLRERVRMRMNSERDRLKERE